MKTYMAKKKDIKRKWFLVDADGKILGRLATRIAIILRGKHKPEYTPHVDCGDGVVVINASKIKVTGNKMKEKEYVTFSGYPGGRRVRSMEHMMKLFPARVMRLAVKRMIPDTPLGRDMIKKLKVYAGTEHKQKAQDPQEIKL
ncbi:MAG: 50S ribosomal protein L13 [Candidatus Omnitrophica bacterium]|nr:50S ribosomal protein L13 [Candidatus Omnitrophota bacterium]